MTIWNKWRENYHEMTFKDQKQFYDAILTLYPDQDCFNIITAVNFFTCLNDDPVKVLELGGYKGKLANILFVLPPPSPEILNWTNFEIASLAKKEKACHHERYHVEILDNHLWEMDPSKKENDFDVFFSSHTIEHFSGADLKKLIAWLKRTNVQYIYLEAPLVNSATDYSWTDYEGSHILELGWLEVIDLFLLAGFFLFSRVADSCSFVRL